MEFGGEEVKGEGIGGEVFWKDSVRRGVEREREFGITKKICGKANKERDAIIKKLMFERKRNKCGKKK